MWVPLYHSTHIINNRIYCLLEQKKTYTLTTFQSEMIVMKRLSVFAHMAVVYQLEHFFLYMLRKCEKTLSFDTYVAM